MTRELPKPVAVPLGWVICGAINTAIYGGGWLWCPDCGFHIRTQGHRDGCPNREDPA